jgi:hypothetical protein
MDRTYSKQEVRRLLYQAYKHGQGGHSRDEWQGRLSLQNRRLTGLRKLFPLVFGKHPATAAAERRHQQPKIVF